METQNITFKTTSSFNPLITHGRLQVSVSEDTMFDNRRVSLLLRYLDESGTPIQNILSQDDLPVGDKVASSSCFSDGVGDPYQMYVTCMRRYIKRQDLSIDESERSLVDAFYRSLTTDVGQNYAKESA